MVARGFSQADSVSLNRERTSLQRWKYISERGVVLGLMPMAVLLLDRTRTSRNIIIFLVNTFSFILPSTTSIDPLSLQDLPVTIIILSEVCNRICKFTSRFQRHVFFYILIILCSCIILFCTYTFVGRIPRTKIPQFLERYIINHSLSWS